MVEIRIPRSLASRIKFLSKCPFANCKARCSPEVSPQVCTTACPNTLSTSSSKT
ncbi:hypothetical protein [Fontibacillus sp. BL9]|uniref:hypothetical protein n=1 Tax=Fontibacillus sp. BL9 TaxID=3389971 RepID=UPI00397D0EFB